jgi:two-component system cell cycle sensor histidine kinase/response regulator CckA
MKTDNRRILVIDDNVAIHQDFRKIFQAPASGIAKLADFESALFGCASEPRPEWPVFKIDCASQGEEGLAMVRRAAEEGQPYAMAFVDVRMPPGWDGIETTARLWAAYPDLQVVICTAYSDYSFEDMLEKLGHSDRLLILKKPFDNIEVLQLAIALTQKWHLQQQARGHLGDLERLVQERTRELEAANEKLRLEIDEHQRAALKLSATQEKLGHLLASSPAVIYSYKVEDQKLVPSWISENITDVLGYSAEEWSTPGWGIFSTDDQKQEVDTRQTLFEHGYSSHEFRLRRKDGSFRWLRNERKLLRSSRNSRQVVGAYTDVTERRQLEEQLRQSQKMEAIGQLAGGVAHDFNNLLTVIGGYTHMLLSDTSLHAKTTDSLSRIAWASDRAADLTRRLLTYGRKQVMQPAHFKVGELIREVSKILHRLLGEHITLKTEGDALGLTLLADRTMIEQIIMNLAVNARDAMPDGGTLTIQVQAIEASPEHVCGKLGVQPGCFVGLTITDTGRGIPPEILPRIFEPFFTTKDVGQGTGLGLATVHGIVKSHHGWIEVESIPGAGSAFKIFLPSSSALTEVAIPIVEEIKQHRQSQTILLVEDETALRQLGRTILEKQGHRVLEAVSGVEALEVWKNNSGNVDLLFTDMVMPGGITGGKLAAKLQAEKPNLKVLFTSGYSTELLEDDFVLRDGMNFLPKPFNPRSLLTAVSHCLDGQRAPRTGSLNTQFRARSERLPSEALQVSP